jgi:hypothetical protein
MAEVEAAADLSSTRSTSCTCRVESRTVSAAEGRYFVSGKLLIVLSVAVLALASASCKKLESPTDFARGKMMTEAVPFDDAIPAEYGRLVGVSPVEKGWNALWFEKENGTIVVIGVHWVKRKMLNRAAVIPRK